MASGIKTDPECQAEFTKMHLGKEYRYIIFKISDDEKNIVVEKVGSIDASYEEFLSDLKGPEPTPGSKPQCRYAAYDYRFTKKNGASGQKMVFVTWSPEGAAIKQKMIYSSSKDNLHKSLKGIQKTMQACDHDEICQESMHHKCADDDRS